MEAPRLSKAITGSSPREWGVFTGLLRAALGLRFIPTRVGSISARRGAGWCRSVHPHASGEYRASLRERTGATGSSPREWGVWRPLHGQDLHCRFIPTRVGSIRAPAPARLQMPVHPHASGEYRIFWVSPMPPGGSSPREWGVFPLLPFGLALSRFIPTRVGSMRPAPVALRAACGSSPREWGVFMLLIAPASLLRFIPTRVGSIKVCRLIVWCPSVHPHASGEYLMSTYTMSPNWFIPTRVGSMIAGAALLLLFLVHPHASGEYQGAGAGPLANAGSSPREWG